MRLKKHFTIKHGLMKTPRTSTFAKTYSFKCHCWRYIFDNRFWISFNVEIMTKSELWLAVGYMKLFVDRDLNCDRYVVLPSWQYLKAQIALCQAVYGERPNSNLSLYCTPDYSADSATLATFLYNEFSYSHYLCALLPPPNAVQFIQSIQQHTVAETVIRL